MTSGPARVIQGMRAMLKKENVVIEPVDLNQIATSVVQMVRNEATLRGMRIELALSSTDVVVKGDQIALQQVVLNLASNGLDAMMDTTAERRLTLRTTIEPDASVGTIWVEDTGPGVPHGRSGQTLSTLLHHQDRLVWEWDSRSATRSSNR